MGLSSFYDGLNVTFECSPGSREKIVQSALIEFPSEFFPAQFILNVAFLLTSHPAEPPRAG